ncbi:Gfo/Idh/MocA family oxidoreductase [Rubinisphaera sp. JC750]|uniref:Gfo/Idh/MocA family oxidoreductase n=1 Tax=Rubinisphaera sp. JC750 TaxID=2898658 RepID=UPI001F301CFA|nr:Gfo/Idh/MocA family oxidoreductase [Rubinisphaera sp. JC750]
MKNFALIGAAGYIAPRHMAAIHETGNRLVAAVDPHDCVGRIDSYFPEARFFTEIERFDRHLEKLRRSSDEEAVDFVSVCTPNYLHDAHARLGMRVKANVICEKPLVISPWNLDALEELEQEHGTRIYNVLQLRLLPSLLELKRQLDESPSNEPADICLTYITRRGRWYDTSWKGAPEKSGGVAMNIGIHFFDLLLWLFGPCAEHELHVKHSRKMAGTMRLERANVRWFLSTDETDLPAECREAGKFAYRSMTMNGTEIEFTGFTDLHTRVYADILAGNGYGIQDARPAVNLVHGINCSDVANVARDAHPYVATTRTDTFSSQRRAA